MSTPFWIFMVALSAICLWALVSRNLFSRRIAAHTKAEEALDARMIAFKERVSTRNARVLAEKPKERSTDDKSRVASDDFLKDLYVSDALGRVMLAEPPSRYRYASPGRFAGGGAGSARAVLLDNGTCLWLDDRSLVERLTEKIAFGQVGYENVPRPADYTKPPKPIFPKRSTR
ncbi:hypothetical protein AB0V79_17185 [Mesorhizobium ciceri]|uniref:hypothetical protein n=1 Tax=Mesorhizobium ciceri TaxID=39645 RepID=UPI0007A95232|nr:hypothetical protein [Mesorhizobium ciceri]AMX99990.1 hypothetical protein A4R29_11165 [Mesorhizobium ciceri biovar biserrulae]